MRVRSDFEADWQPSVDDVNTYLIDGLAPDFLSDALSFEPLEVPVRLLGGDHLVNESTLRRLCEVQGENARNPFTLQPLTAATVRRDEGSLPPLDALRAAVEGRLRAAGDHVRAAELADLRRRCRRAAATDLFDVEAAMRPWLAVGRSLARELGIDPPVASAVARLGPARVDVLRRLARAGFRVDRLGGSAPGSPGRQGVMSPLWARLRPALRGLVLPTAGLAAGLGLLWAWPAAAAEVQDPTRRDVQRRLPALLGVAIAFSARVAYGARGLGRLAWLPVLSTASSVVVLGQASGLAGVGVVSAATIIAGLWFHAAAAILVAYAAYHADRFELHVLREEVQLGLRSPSDRAA